MIHFRKPSGDVKKRKEIEKSQFPKKFRYFYYYDDISDVQQFTFWFEEVLKTCYKVSDLSWLLNGLCNAYKQGLALSTAQDMYELVMQLVADYPLLENEEFLPFDFPEEIKGAIFND